MPKQEHQSVIQTMCIECIVFVFVFQYGAYFDSLLTFVYCVLGHSYLDGNRTKMSENDGSQEKEEDISKHKPQRQQGRHAHSLWHTHDFRPVKENNRYYAYCKICKRVIKTTAVDRLLKHRFALLHFFAFSIVVMSSFFLSIQTGESAMKVPP